MKHFLFIPFLFFLSSCFAKDYIIEFQAKVKNLKELKILKEMLHIENFLENITIKIILQF